MFPEDIFSHIFGGGGGGSPFGGGLFGGLGGMFGGGRGRRGPQKGQDTLHPLRVSLEDLYNGKTSKLQLSKQVICTACKGLGGKEGATQVCSGCKGRGVKVTMRSLGPGMVQQMQSVCHDCRGQGTMIAEKDRCGVCGGKKTTKDSKILEVHVAPGMRDGQRITFRGEGDQEPGIEPGDVVIVIQQKEHEVLTREADNLFLKRSVTLAEALCGFYFVINHLDARHILFRTAKGDVIEHGAVRGVIGQGMPRTRNHTEFGHMYIRFEVEFPPNHFTTEAKLLKLEKYLPPRPKAAPLPPKDQLEEVSVMPFEDHHRDSSKSGRREAYHDDDDEDEDESGGHRVQCAHQ